MLQKILLLALVISSLHSKPTCEKKIVDVYYKQLRETLSYNQKEVLVSSYLAGKPYDLEYTLMAIAWKESVFGKFKINLADGRKGSFGIYHCLLDSALKRLGRKGKWADSRVAEKLIFDRTFSQKMAISELKFWDRYWSSKKTKYKWSHVIASYNAGYKSLNSKCGKKYLEDIKLRIKALKKYIKHSNLSY